MSWIRRNLKILVPATAVMLAGVGFLAFGVFGVHTLFIDDTVSEAAPVFDSGVAAAAVIERPTEEASEPSSIVEPDVGDAEAGPADPIPTSTDPPSTDATSTDATSNTAPQVVTLAEGTFIPRGRYSGQGTALVLNDGSEQRFVRFENFATDNGPDLRVYLSTSDANAEGSTFDDDFVDLGVLKGNIGDQNYEIPPDVDLAVYDTVVVWCERFSSVFTAADLIPTA